MEVGARALPRRRSTKAVLFWSSDARWSVRRPPFARVRPASFPSALHPFILLSLGAGPWIGLFLLPSLYDYLECLAAPPSVALTPSDIDPTCRRSRTAWTLDSLHRPWIAGGCGFLYIDPIVLSLRSRFQWRYFCADPHCCGYPPSIMASAGKPPLDDSRRSTGSPKMKARGESVWPVGSSILYA